MVGLLTIPEIRRSAGRAYSTWRLVTRVTSERYGLIRMSVTESSTGTVIRALDTVCSAFVPLTMLPGYGDESSMQRMHAGNGDHRELDERCLALFAQALADVGIPAGPAERLAAHFGCATDAQRAYGASAEQVPDSLPLPRWE
jgi:hypothetical protein